MEQTGWELLLPEGVLDYFEVKSVNQPEDGYEIELEERPQNNYWLGVGTYYSNEKIFGLHLKFIEPKYFSRCIPDLSKPMI